jgi:hypothetical protein
MPDIEAGFEKSFVAVASLTVDGGRNTRFLAT